MKKVFPVLFFLLIMFCLFMLIIQKNNASKDNIIRYFKMNQQELSFLAEEMILNSKEDTHKTYEEYDVFYWQKNNMVEFIVKKQGIGSANHYKGFYYSPTDKPIGFQGNIVQFRSDGNGWIWEDAIGDNWEYTEKIKECWYYYEMHF